VEKDRSRRSRRGASREWAAPHGSPSPW
jgi:hypothetical protein